MEGTTWYQEAKRRLGCSHPAEQLMSVLDRVEKLEGLSKAKETAPVAEGGELTRSEKMKAAWARRKAAKNG